ncbi:nuclear pore complex protein [Histomonas meleagridis]|uniref:nuclear pore complex protein n=1 Tax=Histomonas meleagridis TaxID=135588 RepID=UPI00355A8D68|nr:nuclear pore complex protein [Histomonas meleagridis]KAH0804676.1 nuclear pore complex protein [Histomonas meleagridis]
MNKGDPTKVDPETSFFKAYQTTEITSDVLVKSVEEARQTISHVTNVTTSYVISDLYNPKLITFSIFTHHVFTTTIRDRESQSFYEAILSVAKFLGYLDQMYIKGQEIKPFIDRVQEVLYDKWNDCVRCPILQDVMKAGFALVADDTDMITRSFTSKTIRFISDIILLQSSLTQSIVFQHVLEIFGRIFAIIPVTNHMNIISSFIDEEKVKTQTEAKHNNDGAPLQPFLRLIRNVSGLQNGIDFAVDFFQKGKTLLLNVTNYISPSLYCTFLQTFSCLIKSEELANNVLQLFEESESFSDVVNLKRFISAINGHAKDLSSHRVGQQLLSDEESYGLEAVIQLLMAISYHSKEYRRRLFATEKIVNSFFLLISSPIPASLKAKCFDILSVLSIEPKQCDEIYKIFSSTQILTRDNVESGRGGIISEIEEIESEEHLYPLTRSFIRFLSSLFKYNYTMLDEYV